MSDDRRLREADIRPEGLMAGQQVAMLTDVGRLLTRRAEFVCVSCPACARDEADPLFEKFGLQYACCRSCGMWYMNPRPSEQVLEWFYRGSVNYAYWNRHIFPASEEARRRNIFAPRVDRVLDLCRRHGISSNALLEVGAAFGTFCVELRTREVFQRIAAVEPTPDLAATCRERGLDVFELPVEQLDIPTADRFDVVVAFEVIEHLFEPASFMRKCATLLRDGGMLALTCPSAAGFDTMTLGPLSATVDHEHLNYFTPASMHVLLGRCGFRVLEYTTPGRLDAELVRKLALSGQYDLSRQPFLRKVLIDEWDELGDQFQDFLSTHRLSSNLWVAAAKGDHS